jgi:hypothetical protein
MIREETDGVVEVAVGCFEGCDRLAREKPSSMILLMGVLRILGFGKIEKAWRLLRKRGHPVDKVAG